jgi:hypothetical protein
MSTRIYAAALRKHFLAERMTREERKELRRRRLPDGSYPMPALRIEDLRRLPVHFIDPRLVRS